MSIIKWLLQKVFPKSFILGRIKGADGIFLTFDDGPHPVHTPVILDELAKRDIKAAFFVTGSELEKYPELGKRIIAEGHLLGNHTFNHLNIKDVPFSEYLKSMEKTENIIRGIYDNEVYQKLFRPPYSTFSHRLVCYIAKSDYLLFNWNIDSQDSFIESTDKLINYVADLPLSCGDILLFHEDYEQTVRALPTLLSLLEKYRFLSLDIIQQGMS